MTPADEITTLRRERDEALASIEVLQAALRMSLPHHLYPTCQEMECVCGVSAIYYEAKKTLPAAASTFLSQHAAALRVVEAARHVDVADITALRGLEKALAAFDAVEKDAK